jgi:hypothetical protein
MRVLGLLLCLVTASQGECPHCCTWDPGEAVTTDYWQEWHFLSPGVLSELQLQESGPVLVKPLQTLSLTCAVSGYSITTTGYCSAWICQLPVKELEWIGHICYDGSTGYIPSLSAQSPSPETLPRISSYSSWALWPQRTWHFITVTDTLWGDFILSPGTNHPAGVLRLSRVT